MDDAQFLLDLKNDETMRLFSVVSHDKIEMGPHLKWLEKNKDRVQIITDGTIDYGTVRLDGDEVAINIDKAYRHMGIGYKALNLLCTGDRYTAKIINENYPSLGLFKKFGFKEIGVILEYKK